MFIIKSSKKNKDNLFDNIYLLGEIRKALVKDKIAKKICKEHSVSLDFLSGVTIKFDKIKPSAKTVDAEIILNNSLKSKSFEIIMRYVIHEVTHAIQHAKNQNKKKSVDKSKDYLDKETEIEAFQNQIEYDSEQRGEKEAIKYVEDLLDYHDIDGKKREEKKEELLEGV